MNSNNFPDGNYPQSALFQLANMNNIAENRAQQERDVAEAKVRELHREKLLRQSAKEAYQNILEPKCFPPTETLYNPLLLFMSLNSATF